MCTIESHGRRSIISGVHDQDSLHLYHPCPVQTKCLTLIRKACNISKPNRLTLIHNNLPFATYIQERKSLQYACLSKHTYPKQTPTPPHLPPFSKTPSPSQPLHLPRPHSQQRYSTHQPSSSTPVHRLTTFLNCASSSVD